jgi:hypothetical protein
MRCNGSVDSAASNTLSHETMERTRALRKVRAVSSDRICLRQDPVLLGVHGEPSGDRVVTSLEPPPGRGGDLYLALRLATQAASLSSVTPHRLLGGRADHLLDNSLRWRPPLRQRCQLGSLVDFCIAKIQLKVRQIAPIRVYTTSTASAPNGRIPSLSSRARTRRSTMT